MTAIAAFPLLTAPALPALASSPDARLIELGRRYLILDEECDRLQDHADVAYENYKDQRPELPAILVWQRTDIIDNYTFLLKDGQKVQRVNIPDNFHVEENREKLIRKFICCDAYRDRMRRRLEAQVVAHEKFEAELALLLERSGYPALQAKFDALYDDRWDLIDEAAKIAATTPEGMSVKAQMIAKHDHSNLKHFSETGAYDEIIESLLRDLLRLFPRSPATPTALAA